MIYPGHIHHAEALPFVQPGDLRPALFFKQLKRIGLLNHRLGRVLSFSQVVGIGTPTTPHSQASVPPPPVLGRGAHVLCGLNSVNGSASILVGWIRIRTEKADPEQDPGGPK
jgi:hypothetical protein